GADADPLLRQRSHQGQPQAGLADSRSQQGVLTMRSIFVTLISIGLLAAGSGLSAEVPGGARLKDIAALQGPAATSVVGYGLVVGLNKTGDRKQTIFSAQTLASMLER